MKTGMTSVTFRKLSIDEIIDLVKKAGLDGIEWGGDVHVAPGDFEKARLTAEKTKAAGLAVSSYGSYFKPGEGRDFSLISDTAKALGTDVIRIWMPFQNYDYKSIKDEICLISDIADKNGQTVCFEFHVNTANDSPERSKELISYYGRENIRTYWQPPYWPPEWSLNDVPRLSLIKDKVMNLHVYQWKDGKRFNLSEGTEEWRKYIETFDDSDSEIKRYAILEFVKNDDPAEFLKDAETLKNLVK